MKKLAILILTALMAAVFLAGCSQPVPKRQYYYKFGFESTYEEDAGLIEHTTYTVTGASDRTFSNDFGTPPYYLTGEGTYDVKLYTGNDTEFRLVTGLTFKGKYFYTESKTYSEEFTETVTGESTFTVNPSTFYAKNSEKTFHTYVPYRQQDGKFGLKQLSYKVTSAYESGEKNSTLNAKVADIDVFGAAEDDVYKVANDGNAAYSLGVEGRYLDNEHIYLGIRMQELTSGFTDSFYVFSPVDKLALKLKVATAATDENAVEIRKLDGNDVECIKLSASLDATNKGKDMYFYYSTSIIKSYYNDNIRLDGYNLSLLMEFSQEDLVYTVSGYKNYAAAESQSAE